MRILYVPHTYIISSSYVHYTYLIRTYKDSRRAKIDKGISKYVESMAGLINRKVRNVWYTVSSLQVQYVRVGGCHTYVCSWPVSEWERAYVHCSSIGHIFLVVLLALFIYSPGNF